MLCLCVSVLCHTLPCPCHSLPCYSVANQSLAIPLRINALHRFSKPCLAFAYQSSASAMLSYTFALLNVSLLCRCSVPPRNAMSLQCVSLLLFAIAISCHALPLPLSALHFRCESRPHNALATLRLAIPLLIIAPQCLCHAFHVQAMPQPISCQSKVPLPLLRH